MFIYANEFKSDCFRLLDKDKMSLYSSTVILYLFPGENKLYQPLICLVSEVKRQRSVPEVAEERGALTEADRRKPTEDEVLHAYLNSQIALLVLVLSVTSGHSWTSHSHTVTHICLRAGEGF